MCSFVFGLLAQDNYFVPQKVGTTYSYSYYDKKGKPVKTSKSKQEAFTRCTVEEVFMSNDTTVIQVLLESNLLDDIKGGKEKTDNEVENALLSDIQNMKFKIYNNILYADNLFGNTNQMMEKTFGEMLKGNVQMDMKIDIQPVKLPINLSVGETLPDEESMKMVYKISSPMNMSMSTINTLKNRKIIANEDVDTPAGTFNCFKLSYDSELVQDMGIMKQSNTEKVIEWLSPKLGAVKIERYNKKGNLISTMIIKEFKEP